jgi:hypothetical protein
MKKILIIFLLFLITGCTNQTDDIDIVEDTPIDEYVQHKSYEGYASHIQITEHIMPINERLPQKYFNGSYTHIKYAALTKQLCLTAVVNDNDYRNATYYLVGRKVGTANFGQSIVEFLAPGGMTSKKVCFNNTDLSQPFEVLLTKMDRDDLNPWPTLYSVNTITFVDTKAYERQYVSHYDSTNLAPTIYEPKSMPFISFSCEFKDPGKTIDKVHVVLFNPTNNTEIAFKTMDISEADYEGDHLKLNEITFDGVAPNLKYLVQVFADGHDGVDAFERVTIGNYSYTTGGYEISTSRDAFHDLYAVITDIKVIGDSVFVYYTGKNLGTVTYSDTWKEVDMTVFIKAYGDLGQTEQRFSLDLTKSYFELPFESVKRGFYIHITDSRYKYSFSQITVSGGIKKVLYYPTEDKTIMINFLNHSDNKLLSFRIDILDENNTVVETIEGVKPEFGFNTYPYIGDYDFSGNYKLLFTYEVESLIGVLTHTQEIPFNNKYSGNVG